MIGVFLLFVLMSVLIFFGIQQAKKMTAQQVMLLTKMAFYAIISATLAMLLLFGISTLNF